MALIPSLHVAALAMLITRADIGMDNIDTASKCYPESNCWEIS